MCKKILAGAISLVLAVGCLTLPESVLSDSINKSAITASADDSDYSSDANSSDLESSNTDSSDVESSDADSSQDDSDEDSEFKTFGDFVYAEYQDDNIAIVDYLGSAANLSIPSKMDGKKVSLISSYAFADSDVVSVTISDNVIALGEGAFYNCKKLKEIKTSSKSALYYIGTAAFYGCKSLKNVKLPASIGVIDSYAFYDTAISGLTLPEGFEYVGELAFGNCANLRAVTLPKSLIEIGNLAFGYTFGYYDKNDNVNYYNPVKGFKINCISGSEGQKYAVNNSFTYCFSNPGFQVTGFKAVSTTNTTVKLTWNEIPKAQGYIIYRYDPAKKTWVRVAKSNINVTTYTFKKGSAGTTYKFAVKAYKIVAGKEITSATYPIVTTATNPAAVSGFKAAAASESAVKLSWNKVSGATGYVVYRASAGKWVRVGVVNTNSFYEDKLKSGTSYRYAVKAYKTVGGKNYYSPSYPTLWTSTNPATVNFTLTAGSNKAVVKWSKVTGATGYKVYYKTSAKDKWVGLTTTTGTSYAKTELTKGKTYYFTVKAYRTVNGKTYNGAFVTKSVIVK